MTLQNAQPHSIANHEGKIAHFFPNQASLNKITNNENESILYYDTSVLSGKLSMPVHVKRILPIFIIAAALIGCGALYTYYDNVIKGPQIQQEQMLETLENPADVALPNIASLTSASVEDAQAALSADGSTVIEKTSTDADSTTLVKLPEGMSEAEALSMYAVGVDSLSEADLIKLLNGSYTMTTTAGDKPSIVVRYADLTSASIDDALTKAMETQGYDQLSVDDSGTDSSGNTYKTGKITIDGAEYRWRISAVPLSEMYTVPSLPENSYYVGIRIS